MCIRDRRHRVDGHAQRASPTARTRLQAGSTAARSAGLGKGAEVPDRRRACCGRGPSLAVQQRGA
eukprot:5867192-Alexandrium_andersonii.AAC.1